MKNKFLIIISFMFAFVFAVSGLVACDNGVDHSSINTLTSGEQNVDTPSMPTVPSAIDDDIFGSTDIDTRPTYSDKDEFNGTATYSENGLMASSTGGLKSVLYTWEATDKYSLYTALIPFWRTQNVYNETVTFKGLDDEATLLYAPTRIISVYDYYLEKEYVQGEDYVIEGNKIKLTQNTSISYWTNYYADTPNSSLVMINSAGKYIYASETEPNRHQISVSYEHDGSWTGAVPVDQSSKIPNTISKLKNGQQVKIGIIGDSITYGRGSSGDFGYGARNPRYASLVYNYLNERYPASDIICENVAVGGTASAWGSTEAGIGNFTIVPDIAIVAFGMNDIYTELATYNANMKKIVDGLRAMNANMEIVLVSPMTGNKEIMRYDSSAQTATTESHYGHMAEFENELAKISTEYSGIIVAPVSGITKSIYDTGKRFEDVNSNNLNHPNDFIHRVYAQTILKVMIGDDFIAL